MDVQYIDVHHQPDRPRALPGAFLAWAAAAQMQPVLPKSNRCLAGQTRLD